MSTMKSKSISFNIDVPEEKDLYAWCVAQKNFSGYVKDLISIDKKKKPVAPDQGSTSKVYNNRRTTQ